MTRERKAARTLLRRSVKLWGERARAFSRRDFDTVNLCDKRLLALRPQLVAAIAALERLEGRSHGNA